MGSVNKGEVCIESVKERLMDNYPEIMNPKMVAHYLGIGYSKALTLVKSGAVPCIKIGNSYKVSKEQFKLLLNEPGLRKVL